MAMFRKVAEVPVSDKGLQKDLMKKLVSSCIEDAKVMQVEPKIGRNVGKQNWINYQVNANLDVGALTLAFNVFHDLLAKARLAWAEQRKAMNAKSPAIRRVHADLAQKWMKDPLVVLKTVFQNDGKGEDEYVSPFGSNVEDAAGGSYIPFSRVSMKQIKAAYARGKTMAATPANCMRLFHDMTEAARYFQEKTIDATKTSDQIVIPRVAFIKKVKMMSRKAFEAAVAIKFDWAKGIVSSVHAVEDSKHVGKTVEIEGEKVREYRVNDIMNLMRLGMIKNAEDLALELAKKKQEIPAGMKADAEAAAKAYPDAAGAFLFVRGRSADLAAAKRLTIKVFNERFNGKGSWAAEKRRLFREAKTDEYNRVYPAISSMLREIAEAYDLEPETVGKLALWTAMQPLGKSKKEDKENAKRLSAFASRNLQEEFFLYVMDFFGNEVDHQTEDRLLEVGDEIQEGEVLELALGYYQDPANEERYVKSMANLNGRFIMHHYAPERDGDDLDKPEAWSARRNFLPLVRVPESSDELIFVSKLSAKTLVNIRDIIDGMRGKMVYLVPYYKDAAKNIELHDAILVDGVVIGQFLSSVGRYSDPDKLKKKNKGINRVLAKLYRKKGKVKFFDYKVANDGRQLVVCLSDTSDYEDSEIQVKESRVVKKAASKPSGSGKFAALMQKLSEGGKAAKPDDAPASDASAKKAAKPQSKYASFLEMAKASSKDDEIL